MYFLPALRRKRPEQCLSELWRRFLGPAHPAEEQLERRRLSWRVSGQHNRSASPRGCTPSPAIRRSHQINPTGIAMTRISILYPNKEGARFDMRYYVYTHMPLSIELLSAHPGFKGVSVERGLCGTGSGAEAAFVAICHFLFDSIEDFIAAFTPHAARLQGDMPNYTDIEPVIQFNEVLISQ
jgi:uncharacterized protein (TIGR02118 family)